MSGKYKVGYVPGVYDMFHTGHLNLLKNSKARCGYLIAGVLTDELAAHFKHRLPVIPYEERAAIVEAVRYVDEVIPVTFENTKKIDAWKQIHFDCHFSGDDHGPDWTKDLIQLQKVGSAMEYFPYTKGISSTEIRQILTQGKLEEEMLKGRIAVYGAGIRGQKLKEQVLKNGQGKIVLWMDRDYESYRKQGFETDSILKITEVSYDKVVVAIKDLRAALDARRELRKEGVPLEKILMWTEIC